MEKRIADIQSPQIVDNSLFRANQSNNMLTNRNRIFVLFYHNSCLMKNAITEKQHCLTFSTIFVIYQKFTSFTVKFINLLCIIEIYSSKRVGSVWRIIVLQL